GRALWRPLLVFAVSRVAVFLVVMGADYRRHVRVLRTLRAADAAWFLEVVRHGYPQHIPLQAGRAAESTLGFFPSYPLAIRAVRLLPGVSLEGAAVVVTLVAGAAAA